MTIPQPAPPGGPDAGTRTVLLVEDDAAIVELLGDYLHEAGYRVIAAPTVNEALDALRTTAFAAAIVDMNVPGGSGRQVVLAVPDKVPVIIFSGAPEETGGLEEQRSHTTLVAKPYPATLLLEILDHAIAEAGGGSREGGAGR